MVYVQLPVFNKSKEECVTNFDRWIYVLKNLKMMKTMTFEMEQDGVFARLAKVTSVAALSPEEQHQYYRDLKYKNDYIAGLEHQWNTGLQQGLQQGREEGLEEATWKIAQTMKEKGEELSTIALYTGLSISELEKGLK